ncbi:MAG: hypothetical protein IIB22_07945 [Chloroflexi bacterium]|nr:hypothetical protein [Chloroflexota bacterium]
MKDYEIQLRVKNNYLLTAMRENGYFGANDLARASGISSGVIYDLLALKSTAISKNGKIREVVIRIADFLKRDVRHLFPLQHFDQPLKTNRATMKVNLTEVETLFYQEHTEAPMLPDAAIEAADFQQALNDCLGELKPRERKVLALRFGLDGEEPLTIKATAKPRATIAPANTFRSSD